MKKALITGITGQDGSYLAKALLDKGYDVFGTYRRVSTPNFWRLLYFDIYDDIKLIPADLIDGSSLIDAIKISEPDEVYHLAAQSFVSASFEQSVGTVLMTGLGVIRMLEAIRQINPAIKFYQASTSELYGNASTKPINEETPFNPASPYAAAKLYGYWITKIYQKGYHIFACNGILFNHESEVRGLEFVTRKITNKAAKIALGLEKELLLGNVQSKRDWGYAQEYVESMYLMLQQKDPGDFVIATNETHSVLEFVERTFDILGLDWQEYVKVDDRFFRPLDVDFLQGDYGKAEHDLGWKPKIRFEKLVEIMAKKDMDRWQRWQNGERFPWDAPNYPYEVELLKHKPLVDKR